MNEIGLENLSQAVVKQACVDYLKARKLLAFYEDKDSAIEKIKNEKALWRKKEYTPEYAERIRLGRIKKYKNWCEETKEFFHSERYKFFTNISGEKVYIQLNKMADEGRYSLFVDKDEEEEEE